MFRYQGVDGDAGGLLIEKLSQPLFQYFLAQVRDRALAEDLLQNFWLRVHRSRATYRPGEPVLPWLYAIAHRTRVDDYRKNRRWRQRSSLDELTFEIPAPSSSPETPLSQENIYRMLEQLPPSQRDVIVMMKINGLSLEEVARATGTTIGSVKQKVHRGYSKLRTIFTKAGLGAADRI